MRLSCKALLLAAFTSTAALACGSSSTTNDSTADAAAPALPESEAGAPHAWSQTGLDGDIVNTVAIDPKAPTRIYLSLSAGSADKGFRRSKDGGQTWTKIAGGLPDDFSGAIAVHPQLGTVLANPGVQGIWRSTDGGDSWTKSNDDPGGVNAFLFHPTKSTAWTVTSQQGVFRSIDGGASFTKTPNTGLPLNKFTLGPLAYDGTKLYLATDANGVYVSTDDGDSWTQTASSGLPDGAHGGSMLNIVATTSRPEVIFVETNAGGIFRSTDGGASFTKLDTGSNRARYGALRVDPSNATTLYVSVDETSGGSGGLLESTNDGQSWSALGPSTLPVAAVDVAPDGTVFAGTIGKGIWRFGN